MAPFLTATDKYGHARISTDNQNSRPRLATRRLPTRREPNPLGRSDLERSHDELRGALIFAANRIKKLNFGRRDDPSLPILRRVLGEARAVSRKVEAERKQNAAQRGSSAA